MGACLPQWQLGVVAMRRAPKLTDIRQIGPDSERHISGVCSACGTVLFARIGDREPIGKLRVALTTVFQTHLAEQHP